MGLLLFVDDGFDDYLGIFTFFFGGDDDVAAGFGFADEGGLVFGGSAGDTLGFVEGGDVGEGVGCGERVGVAGVSAEVDLGFFGFYVLGAGVGLDAGGFADFLLIGDFAGAFGGFGGGYSAFWHLSGGHVGGGVDFCCRDGGG